MTVADAAVCGVLVVVVVVVLAFSTAAVVARQWWWWRGSTIVSATLGLSVAVHVHPPVLQMWFAVYTWGIYLVLTRVIV